jgi:hypothetical protein
MKRVHRDVTTITSERDAAYARYRELDRELDAHPTTLAESARQKRQTLERRFPRSLHGPILNTAFEHYGKLEQVSVDTELDYDVLDKPSAFWCFEARFEHDSVECRVDVDDLSWDVANGFDCITFRRPARDLWQDALDENDDDAGKALAALFYACYERTADDCGALIKAFPPGKGKIEEAK